MAGTIVVNSPNNINEAQIKEARNAVDSARNQEKDFSLTEKDLTKYVEEINRKKGEIFKALAGKVKSQEPDISREVAKENLQQEDEMEI